jgi:hypothetical protein
MSEQLVTLAIGSVADLLWDYVELKDILAISVVSRSFAQLPVTSQTLNRLITRDPNCFTLGHMKLTFAHELTTGLVRRVMNRLKSTFTATIAIDDRHGRIVLDIGSAFNKNDAFLVRDVHPIGEEEGAGEASTPIGEQLIKEIEISSYDEYDDFNPRHPMMKEGAAHRRGNSLFNSDIYTVTSELGVMNMNRGGSHGFDLSTIAAKAQQEESLNRESHTSASVKNRILAKKQGLANKAGLPPKPSN